MKRTFAIGDIHGCLDLLEDLISRIDPGSDEKVVFLGDYIDRGFKPFETVEYLISLTKRFSCVFLRGNHEQMFIDFLEYGTNRSVFFANGGMRTVQSYLGHEPFVSHTQVAHAMPESHRNFYADMQWFHEDERYVYVHAGLRPGVPIAEQDRQDFIWIRDEFIFSPTGIEKKVIFGHTPFARPLVKSDKIGIDTGAVYGGALTAVELPGEVFIQSRR
ncbi:MAG TPA: metallophosphoesterase family protein [Deltaproteobacteria bacterium]|jgi:serine/threonine protein phosphatase 1|nr:metallophosphoesterase family protein [Deltaproteobacteria bacterium]HOI05815.1 metallophosphoesterase family protein [Deltaproteobacteria bacterium]